ncbi:MAG TPA: hypothetical protein VK914_07485 [bacterium]|jgi:hypothetical protein|nr:hypothetical protein [bacterium]
MDRASKSSKAYGVWAAFLALALGCAACTPLTSSNPLSPGLGASSGSACPAVYSFENGSIAGWNAPTWPGGLIGMIVDQMQAHCGTHALHLNMKLGYTGLPNQTASTSEALAVTYFALPLTLNNNNVQLWSYFGQTPPAGVTMTVVLLNQQGGWAWSQAQSGFSGGAWAPFNATVTSANLAGFELQFSMSGSSTWSGDVWIDDINW